MRTESKRNEGWRGMVPFTLWEPWPSHPAVGGVVLSSTVTLPLSLPCKRLEGPPPPLGSNSSALLDHGFFQANLWCCCKCVQRDKEERPFLLLFFYNFVASCFILFISSLVFGFWVFFSFFSLVNVVYMWSCCRHDRSCGYKCWH